MTCVYCRGALWVVAYTRPATQAGEAYEEVGPCPKCPEGIALEVNNWPQEGFWGPRGGVPRELPTYDTRLAPPQVAREYLTRLSRKSREIGEGVAA